MKQPSFKGVAVVRSGIPGRLRLYMPAIADHAEAAKAMKAQLESTGATLAAVIGHAPQELETKGTFDPVAMSVVYLINSIGKTNSGQASRVALAATFGRHLIPRAPREQVYLVRREGRRTTLIPVQGRHDGADFAGAKLRRGTEMLTRTR